jgi:hypothetical protein
VTRSEQRQKTSELVSLNKSNRVLDKLSDSVLAKDNVRRR